MVSEIVGQAFSRANLGKGYNTDHDILLNLDLKITFITAVTWVEGLDKTDYAVLGCL